MNNNFNIEKLEGEIWVSIPNFENFYEVSNYGRVKTIGRNGNGYKDKIKKQSFNKDGYLFLILSKNGSLRIARVHRLVAESFIPNPENKPQINHKDGVKTNNGVENLEWCTNQENITHARLTGLNNNIGENAHNAKLKTKDVIFIFNSNSTNQELSDLYNVSKCSISQIKNGTTWSHITNKKKERITLTKDKIIEIFNSNLSDIVLSKMYNLHEKSVRRIKIGRVYSETTGIKKYIPYKRNFLSENDVIEIFKSKEHGNILSKKFNVNYATIYDIRQRRTWTKITEKL